MGRWTPLILMAGGLAILLGTVIGTLFPMGAQQNAKVPQTGVQKVSGVLPANINVNNSTSSSSGTKTDKNSRVAQSDATTGGATNSDTSTGSNTNVDQSSQTSPASGSDTGSNNSGSNTPIRALW
jgi:hypothetical protein